MFQKIANFFNKKEEKRAKSQPTEIERLELYHCPHCHAGISSMSFVSGWIFGKGEKRSVKAVIKCNACQRRHALDMVQILE